MCWVRQGQMLVVLKRFIKGRYLLLSFKYIDNNIYNVIILWMKVLMGAVLYRWV